MPIDQTSSYVRELLRRERAQQRQGRFTRSSTREDAVQRARDALSSAAGSAPAASGLPEPVAPLRPPAG